MGCKFARPVREIDQAGEGKKRANAIFLFEGRHRYICRTGSPIGMNENAF